MTQPSWSLLRNLAQVRIVTSMYLWLFAVPLLARLLSELSGVARLTVFGHHFNVDLSLPFTWQVFYFSALCFTFGNIAYFIWCPKIVKDHRTARDFRVAGKGIDQLDDYVLDARMPNAEYEAAKAQVMTHYRTDDDKFHDLFWQVHRHADHQRPIALWVVSIAYFSGLGLITWVFVENFMVVAAQIG